MRIYPVNIYPLTSSLSGHSCYLVGNARRQHVYFSHTHIYIFIHTPGWLTAFRSDRQVLTALQKSKTRARYCHDGCFYCLYRLWDVTVRPLMLYWGHFHSSNVIYCFSEQRLSEKASRSPLCRVQTRWRKGKRKRWPGSGNRLLAGWIDIDHEVARNFHVRFPLCDESVRDGVRRRW